MHFKKVLKLLSAVLGFVAAFMLIPAVMALIWHEHEAFVSFTCVVALIAAVCIALRLISRNTNLQDLSLRDGLLFTSLTWVFATAFGAIPLVMTNTLPNYSDAFFEIISGFTTTGASRIVSVQACLKSILLWRALTNWLGGMGIVVLFIAVLPAMGADAGSFNLMGAETVGPVKGKLTSKTRNTAIIMWTIYFCITLAQTILLLIGGLPFFDSITIAFSTVSTAGFCIKDASIGAYNSAYVDIVVTIFMILASINFTLYFKAITGKIKDALRDSEFRVYMMIILISTLVGAVALRINGIFEHFGTCIRYMAFHIASIISTTGFSTANFMVWPTFTIMVLITMMFLGGCAGSTAGGIKISRIHVLFQSAHNSIRKKNHPNAVYPLNVNNEIVSEETIFSIFAFVVIYIITWIMASVVIALTGVSIQDCLSSTLLSIGNIGLGFGHESFSNYPHWSNWVFSFLMLCGRLELLTVYALFSRSFYKR